MYTNIDQCFSFIVKLCPMGNGSVSPTNAALTITFGLQVNCVYCTSKSSSQYQADTDSLRVTELIMDFVTAHLPFLGLLEKSFIKKIKLAYFIDRKVLIVTKSDEVYGQGPLPDSKLYLDDLELRQIRELRDQQIKKFIFGKNYLFALSRKGEIFSWGQNDMGQLGLGHANTVLIPTLIPLFAENVQVNDVTCGSEHVLALCNNQQVYFWGHGGSTSPKFIAENITGIACSSNGAFYLNSNGEVYGIGYLVKWMTCDFGQEKVYYSIGNDEMSTTYSIWTKIETLRNIKKIAAGKEHMMALNDTGILFVWGNNDKRQLNIHTRSDQSSRPIKFSSISEEVTDIAANSRSNLSAIMTKSSKIYVWGGHRGGSFSIPYLTSFATFDEAFINISNPSMTYDGKSFENLKKQDCVTPEALESVFDKPDDSDLTIIVEENKIYVHKLILKLRSEYFRAMFTKKWKESDKNELKIVGHSYDSFRTFLAYLYTGEIEITSENVFELINIAEIYCEDGLLKRIEDEIEKSPISREMVKVAQDIIKLSPSEYANFCAAMKKTLVSPTLEHS